MMRQDPETMDYYDYEIVKRAVSEYGMNAMEALRRFTGSQTHALLMDADCGLTALGAPAVFDIWVAEQLTGDPRNSINIRGE